MYLRFKDVNWSTFVAFFICGYVYEITLFWLGCSLYCKLASVEIIRNRHPGPSYQMHAVHHRLVTAGDRIALAETPLFALRS